MSEIQEEEYSIHWIEDVLEQVLARDDPEYLLSTGKSPSGSIHIGILRELIITDVIKRKLLEIGKKARTMFIVDDYDPIRSFPPGISLSLDKWSGVPYSDVPDEFGCCDSFGAHWANELIETFPEFGLNHEIVWTSKLYETPEMMEEVRTCLRKASIIRDIMIEYVAKDFNDTQRGRYIESMEGWYPASVVCPECGHLQAGVKGSIVPNRITAYDEATDEVSFHCPYCKYSATKALNNVRVKLTWRVDWPAKWHLFRVSCEPAGKDHAVKGGSYDTGLELSKRVFEWEGPVKVPYEWVQIGGRDMTTSEGIVFNPRTWLQIAPPELYRFLMLKTDLKRTVNIQPDRIPDMVDHYERFERIYYGLEESTEEEKALSHLLYPLSESQPIEPEYTPKLPYKFAILTSQLEELLGRDIIIQKSTEAIRQQQGIDSLPKKTVEHIVLRLERAREWAKQFGSDRDRISVPKKVPADIQRTLSKEDKEFLRSMLEVLRGPPLDDEAMQSAVFEKARGAGIKDRRAFIVMYRILISSKSGPRLGPFLNLLGNEWIATRIESVL